MGLENGSLLFIHFLFVILLKLPDLLLIRFILLRQLISQQLDLSLQFRYFVVRRGVRFSAPVLLFRHPVAELTHLLQNQINQSLVHSAPSDLLQLLRVSNVNPREVLIHN